LAAALTGFRSALLSRPKPDNMIACVSCSNGPTNLLPERIDAATVWVVYRELGIEATRENAEWIAVYRQSPIQSLP